MRTNCVCVSFLLFLLAFLCGADVRAQDLTRIPSFEGPVAEVVVSGNRRTETPLIELNIETAKGDPYSAALVREDVKRIYALDFFQQVSVDVGKVAEGLRVEFVVEENPVLADLKLSGNDKLKDDDIKEALQVREGRIISLRKIRESREIILALASDKGLIGTDVEYEIEPRGEGVIDVVYRIDEGDRKYIKRVEFHGNDRLEDKKIKKKLYSKPKYFLSFITKRGLFKIEEIKRDSDRIKAVYLDHGYLDVRVSEPEISYDEEKDGYAVSFAIEEGESYRISKITFSGGTHRRRGRNPPRPGTLSRFDLQHLHHAVRHTGDHRFLRGQGLRVRERDSRREDGQGEQFGFGRLLDREGKEGKHKEHKHFRKL